MNTLGETLKNERIRQGLELKDIENAISIRTLYLNAIEDGNYKVVPGEVYLKGFIRNYSIHLGLNPQQMLELYRQDKATLPVEERLPDETPLPPKNKELPPKVRKYQRRREERREERRKSVFSLGKWMALLLVAAGAIAWGAMNFSKTPVPPLPAQSEDKSSPGGAQSTGAAEQNPPSNTAKPPSSDAGKTPAPPSTPPQSIEDNVTVGAKFNDKCWTQVNVDGKLEYEGTPKAGQTLTFNAKQRIFIKLGNAGAVELTHNGKSLGIAGKTGEVIIKTFAKDTEISVSSH